MMDKKKTGMSALRKSAWTLLALVLITNNSWSALKLVNEDQPLTGVEQMPQYPGGEKALMDYLIKAVHYPVSASEMGIEGRVLIRFVVGTTGSISDVKVVRGLDPACDAEAIRAIKAMPQWTPGRQNGRNVATYFTLPIAFKLKGKSATKLKAEFKMDGFKPDPSNQSIQVEQVASFNGGEKALYKIIHANLKTPASAIKGKISGKVVVRFTIDVKGNVTEAKIMRTLTPDCDKEALRVVRLLPKWTPGRINQKTIPTYITLPIEFNAAKK